MGSEMCIRDRDNVPQPPLEPEGVDQQADSPPPTPPPVELAPPPPPKPTGTRPRVRRPPSEWPSRRKGPWEAAPPTRLLPNRQSANKTFSGARVYHADRRRRDSSSDDENVMHVNESEPLYQNESETAADLSLEWDYSDYANFRPSSDDIDQPRDPSTADLSDQTNVLEERREIAQRDDSRTQPSRKRSYERRSRPPLLASIPESSRTTSLPPSQPAFSRPTKSSRAKSASAPRSTAPRAAGRQNPPHKPSVRPKQTPDDPEILTADQLKAATSRATDHEFVTEHRTLQNRLRETRLAQSRSSSARVADRARDRSLVSSLDALSGRDDDRGRRKSKRSSSAAR